MTWYGEFGRTPRINGGGGRDHWGFCQSIGLTGGGAPAGLVHGASTNDGGYPASDAVSPDDLAATLYHLLGIDHHALMYDLSGRPVPLSYGAVLWRARGGAGVVVLTSAVGRPGSTPAL